MAKRKRTSTARSIQRRLREGRGEGHGPDYTPWLFIQDVPSLGVATRIKGWKTGRVHHLHSKLELQYFYLLEWDEDVLDIREGFPLNPLEDTVAIAEEHGIRYPTDPRSKHPIVMTEDFLITLQRNGKVVEVARAIKYAGDLQSRRTQQKFLIHQHYWKMRGIDWTVVTEQDIPKAKVENIRWVHPYRDVAALYPLQQADIYRAAWYMTEQLIKRTISLAEVAEACDLYFGWPNGFGLSVARHLIANRFWRVDIDRPIHPRSPLMITAVQLR